MKKWAYSIVIPLLFAACEERVPQTVPQTVADNGEIPKSYVRWDMPHIDQSDHRIKAYRYDISALCAPTASANALIWLARNGKQGIKYDNPFSLVAEMAQRARTVEGGIGTYFGQLSHQMVSFLNDAGYDCTFEHMGSEWTKADGGHYIFKPINYELLRRSTFNKNKIALIQILICHYNPTKNTYIATDGHLITFAGYDDEKECLVVADPNEGKSLQHYPFHPLQKQDGVLVDDHDEVCKTSGLYSLGRNDSNTIDIITGVTIFTIK